MMKRMRKTVLFFGISLLAMQSMAAVELSVDAAVANRRAISSRIYGVNIANWAADHYARMCAPMLTNANVSVIRYGATNIERYNWRNNRMYNVISLENQYVPMSWRTFVDWCVNEMNAEAFIQVPMFGQVASDIESSNYNSNQPIDEISAWVEEAGTNVPIWGIGNEPFIAWKLVQYQGDGYKYNDGAHGDQIFLEDLEPEVYFPRWVEIGAAIREANTNATILGPTPANWYLYWGTDYSEFCPSTRARSRAWPSHLEPDGYVNDPGWQVMSKGLNQFDSRVFPGRAGSPDVIGWEENPKTGAFNDKRTMNQFVKQVAEYAATHDGTQVCDYMDFHRYMNTDNEYAAVQELRDLWEPGFQSGDMETGYAHDARILDRFQNILDHYYPGQMGLSLSEYDYFYWQGHPANPQTAALGEIDFLGTFARLGVQLACNWYIGEPDQSGGGYHHAADSAKQAMFNEHGEPNPKYWAFKLMSLNFRDQALTSVVSVDNSKFSIHAGIDTNLNELTVCTFYKGQYEHGAFVEGQGSTNVTMVISNFNITGVKTVQRFGEFDPEIITMEPGGVSISSMSGGQGFSYDYEPLAIYLFKFYGNATPPAETTPDTYLNISPVEVAFGAFNTGVEVSETEDHDTHIVTYTTNYTFAVKVTNNRNGGTTWSAAEDCPWLEIATATNGTAEVTDEIFLTVDRTGYSVGVYSTELTVVTSEGTVQVPVTMEVVPREEGGEARICDFDTGSLAHAWAFEEPYAVGFYDQHGQPADMEAPYIYEMSLDYEDKSAYGGLASMRIDYNRANGDNEAGKLYTAFGTYGHTAGTNTCPTTMWVPPGQPLSNYVFKFDVKTETEGFGETVTKLLVTITDTNGNVGKASTGISDYQETLTLEDGFWQTVSTPLDSTFYDWTWPGGQTGEVINLDFSCISQLSFTPWNGRDDKKGTIWLDNMRIESATPEGDRYPATVLEEKVFEIYESQTVQLDAGSSFDADGTVAGYSWSPAEGLSDPNIANPVFTPPGPGTYVFSVAVVDNDGLVGRDAAQVIIYVQEDLEPSEVILYRDEQMTQPVDGASISNCLDLYVKFVCTSGGISNRIDTARAVFYSDEFYFADEYNNTDPIAVSLQETSEDSRIFTGGFRLATFSNEERAELGIQVGSTIGFSNLFYEKSWTVGSQNFGLETMVNQIEDGISGFNNFGGVWYTYDDSGEGCSSTIMLTNSGQEATPYSTECAYLYSVLGQGSSTDPDVIFAGAANKLTPYEEETPYVACIDASSTSGYEGVSFWIKGNGTRVTVVLKSLGVTNYDDYAYTIEHTPAYLWRQYHIPFNRFEQEGWGHEAVARDAALRQLNAIQFKFSSHIDGQTNKLYIDDIALFGGTPVYSEKAVYNKYNDTTMDGYSGSLNDNPNFDMPRGGWGMSGVARYENWEDTTNLLVNPTFQPAPGENLLTNPHFDDGGGGWTLTGNAEYEDWGGYDSRLVMKQWDGTFGRAVQDVTNIQEGIVYEYDVKAWKNSGYSSTCLMIVEWYDVSDVKITALTNNITSELGVGDSEKKTFTLETGAAPVNAVAARVILDSTGDRVECVQLDDAVFKEKVSSEGAGWDLFGNAEYTNWGDEEMAYRVAMMHWNGDYGSATQRVAVSDNKAYCFDTMALKGNDYSGTVTMSLTWLNEAADVLRIDSNKITQSELLLDNPQSFSMGWIMPPEGAVTAAVAVASSGTSGPAQFESAEFNEYEPEEGDIAWRLTMQHWDGETGSASQIVEELHWDTEYTFTVRGEKNTDYGDGSCSISIIWQGLVAHTPISTNRFTNLQDLMLVGEDSVLLSTTVTSSPAGTHSAKIIIESSSTNGCVQFYEVSLTDGRHQDDQWESWIEGSYCDFSLGSAEGSGSLHLSTTNTDWLCGMYVPPYAIPEDDFYPDVTMTNYADYDGFALKARRFYGFETTGVSQARVRLAVMLTTNKVAATQWYPVHASSWRDYILFPKENFYTVDSVGDDNPANWVVWDNDWTSIGRVIIEYGTAHDQQEPYDILLDDFRPYRKE